MAVTQNTYTGDGVTQNFAFSFTYLEPSHVKATINGTPTTAFTFFNASTLQFTTAPASGASVVIFRETPSNNLLVDYTPGSALREADLEKNFQQILNVSQETQTFAENQSTTGLQAQITTANNNASSALTTANAAQTTANSLAGSISTANSTAASAVSTANSAAATASAASSAASAAQTAVNNTNTLLGYSQRYGFRNAIINPSFRVSARSDGTSGAGWLCDRWYVNAAGSSVTSSRRVTTVGGESGLPSSLRRVARLIVTSSTGSSNYVNLAQLVENVRSLAGETVTLSFYAKADSTSAQISTEFAQFFGTGGSPSSTVTAIAPFKFTVTTSWQRFSLTTTLPSISGKVTGSNNDSWLGLTFWLDAGSSFNSRTSSLGQGSKTVEIAAVQLENNLTATEFEDRGSTTEEFLCMRYYENLRPSIRAYQVANEVYQHAVPYKVSKRISPTMGWATITATGTSTANVQASGTEYYLHYAVKNGSSGQFEWTCDASADAEL